jgi:hypothetical protein
MTPPGPPLGPPAASQPSPQQPPMGWLRLTLQGGPLSTNLITPTVKVNGHRVLAHYGENVVPVWAGSNRVDVNCQWLRTFGRGTLETQVPPGGEVPVFYAAPRHQFTDGAIGHQRQTRPGGLGFALMVATTLVLCLGAFLMPMAFS